MTCLKAPTASSLGIQRDDVLEGADGVLELRLLLEHDADLEVQVAVLVVERQALAQRLERAVVILGAEVGGPQIEEELRPPWLEVHRLAQHRDRLVEALGAAVEEAELHPGVDRARVGAQDALQLRARLAVLAGVHISGGEEVARAKVRRLEHHHAAEGVAGAVVHLLLVEDGAELHPHPRVARGDLGQLLDLRLRLLVAAEPDQEVAQALDERRIVGVGLHGLAIRRHRLFGAVARLVHVPERRPGAVVVGIELDGAREPRDRLVPVLRLDGQATEQELRLRQPRLALRES